MLLASQLGETAKPCAKCIENPAKAKTVTVAKRQRGDAGAVFDHAPQSRHGVGPASRTEGVMTGVKKAKKATQLTPIKSEPCPESAENWHGRALGIVRGSVNFPQSPANMGERESAGVSRSRLAKGN